MTTDVNILLRGQSNALLFDADGGATALANALDAKLGNVNVHIIEQYYQTNNTIYAGTAFLDWAKDGEQQGLINVLKAEPASLKANPTITLWMHNEYDGNNAAVTTPIWTAAVEADAALVRSALGQTAATTPYVFTYVPYPYTAGNAPAAIQAGMNQLSADPNFNASFDSTAMNGLVMDGDGTPGSSHMGPGDVMTVAARLADFMAPEVEALAMGSVVTSPVTTPPVTTPPPVTPPVTTTAIVQTIGTGADSLVLKISQDAWQGSATYTVSVDGTQIGGTLTAGAAFGSGAEDILTLHGSFAAGAHTLAVTFTNDAYGGSATTDRNLHVDGVSFDGTALANGTAGLFSNGTASFAFTQSTAAPPPVVTPPVTTPPVTTPPVTTPPVSTGDSVPAILFGTPGTWGQAADIWEGHLSYGGTDFHTFGATTDWGGVLAAKLAPATWAAGNATHLAFDNIAQLTLDLHAAGATPLTLMAVSAKGGAITTGSGGDTITWVAHSDASGAGNIMTIKTGDGADTVHITAAGLSPLAAADLAGNGSLYNPAYDGRYSTANVTLGNGADHITTDGAAHLVLHAGSGFATAQGGSSTNIFYAGSGGGDFTGGASRDTYVFTAGNGHTTIENFTSHQDVLKIVGGSAAATTTEATTQNGIAGLLVTYDHAGDSVFLAHVAKLAASDMVFA